jgi:hypothetical protein
MMVLTFGHEIPRNRRPQGDYYVIDECIGSFSRAAVIRTICSMGISVSTWRKRLLIKSYAASNWT